MTQIQKTFYGEMCRLIDKASAAYALARREVYDVGPARGSAGLSPEQDRVIASLEVAEENLRTARQQVKIG